MKTIANQFIETLKNNRRANVAIDHRDVLLSILGYTDKQLTGKHPVKHLTFDLWKMAKPEEFDELMQIMSLAGYEVIDEENPALIDRNSDKTDLKGYTKEKLEGMIEDLLVLDPEEDNVTLDRLEEIYTIALYLRKKKIRNLIVVVTAVIITAVVAAGFIMFFMDKSEDEMDDNCEAEDDCDGIADETDDVIVIDDEVIDIPAIPSDDTVSLAV